MPSYSITNREGKKFSVNSKQELTKSQLEEISIKINPARTSDYFKGAASSMSDFGLNVMESAHELGNFLGGKVAEVLYPNEKAVDVPNPWTEFKSENREFYEGDIPDHVKDRLSYKVTKGLSQLPAMIASAPVSVPVLAAQGFSSGRDDYFATTGIDPSTASQDQLEAGRNVGAMVAVPTVVLEKIGLGKITKSLTDDLVKTTVPSSIKKIATVSATEGATEGLEQIASNVIAKDIAKYDKDRGRFEGVGESALVGSIVGGTPASVRYTPSMVKDTAKSTKELVQKRIESFSKARASKKIIDAIPDNQVETSDVGNDLSNKMIGALVEKGVDVEPLIKGGELAKESLPSVVDSFVGSFAKGVDYYRKSEAARIVDDFIRPLNDRVSSISPKVGKHLISFEHDHKKRYHDFYKSVEPALNTFSKIKKENKSLFLDLHKALLRKDFDKAKSIFNQYDDSGSWNSIGKALQVVYKEATQRGSDIGHIEKYFPRFIKDFPKLGKALGYDIPSTQWGKAVKNAEEKKGETLTEEEKGALFGDLIRAKKPSGVEKPKVSFTKQRKIDEVTDELAEFYADPIESLTLYLNQMSDKITRLDYVGAMYDIVQPDNQDNIFELVDSDGKKQLKPKKKRKLGVIENTIKEEVQKGNITDEQVDELHRLLGARFQKKNPMHGFVRGAKTWTHLLFLNSPTTAITQLGDYAYSIHKNGINESLRAFRKPTWRLEDVYDITNDMAFEFSSDGTIPKKLEKKLDTVLTLTGMKAMDKKAKSTFLTGTSNKWKKTLEGKDSKAKDELINKIINQQGFEQGSQTIKDIKSKKKSPNVAEMLLYELSDIAPVSQSDMPLMYSKYPNIRILYALKSYTLKQFNLARKEIFSNLSSGNKAKVKEGFRNLISLSSALALANVPADIIKDFILGKDIDLSDIHTETLWRLLGLNSYTQVVIKREGVGSAFEGMTTSLPLYSFANDLGHDVFNFAPPIISEDSKTTKYILFVGKFLHHWRQ